MHMLVAGTEPQVRTHSYKRPRSMQEECEGTVWLPVDLELRPLLLPLMLSKNTTWLMRAGIMRTQNSSRIWEFCWTLSRKKSSTLKWSQYFILLLFFCCSKLFLNLVLTPLFFLIPDPLGVPEGGNCSLWNNFLDQIKRIALAFWSA